jgi:hypothetical protein
MCMVANGLWLSQEQNGFGDGDAWYEWKREKRERLCEKSDLSNVILMRWYVH